MLSTWWHRSIIAKACNAHACAMSGNSAKLPSLLRKRTGHLDRLRLVPSTNQYYRESLVCTHDEYLTPKAWTAGTVGNGVLLVWAAAFGFASLSQKRAANPVSTCSMSTLSQRLLQPYQWLSPSLRPVASGWVARMAICWSLEHLLHAALSDQKLCPTKYQTGLGAGVTTATAGGGTMGTGGACH